MSLAPEIAALMPQINAQPPMHQRPLAQLRQVRERMGSGPPPRPVARVEDRQIAGGDGAPMRVRLYSPATGPAALPLVLLFHGGGFVFGSIEGNYDHVCRELCAGAHCHVVSVDYRLAPEHRFPAAADDGWAALQWVAAHAVEIGADPARIFLAGGSAGGNLAAVTALRARDRQGPAVRGQVLFYPVTDLPEPPTASSLAFAEGHYLTRADVAWFWEQYLARPQDGDHPYAAPLRAAELAGLPPALVITASHDPLRDEGEHYARRLQQAGVPTQLVRHEGMVHGFLAFPTPAAERALQQAIDWLGAAAQPR